MDRQTDRQKGKQADRKTDRWTDRQTDRQTNKWINKRTDWHWRKGKEAICLLIPRNRSHNQGSCHIVVGRKVAIKAILVVQIRAEWPLFLFHLSWLPNTPFYTFRYKFFSKKETFFSKHGDSTSPTISKRILKRFMFKLWNPHTDNYILTSNAYSND